jgi:hypothetical protein
MNTKYISSREREAAHEKATDWVEERNRLSREQGKEREREKNKSGLKISNWHELRGFSSV